MAKSTFDYQGAKEAGYSDEEIMSHLSQNNPKFDIQGAQEAGYSPEEINDHLINYKPKKSKLEKSARVAGQYALGAAENELLPYEIAVAPLASKEAQMGAYRGNLGEDIERLMDQKQTGVWDQQDEELLQNLTQQMQNPELSEKFVKPIDISVRGLAEKATGLDLKPQGIAEKAASWAGFIKNPAKLANLGKSGTNVKEIIKAISPTGKELLRGIGAGTALEMAEDGEWGPIGQMAAAIVGDVVGGGVAGAAKALTKPKQLMSKTFAKFTPKEKLGLQKDLVKNFRESGIQADIGTLTDSRILSMMQSRLAQSGLTGKGLERLRETITDQVKKEYKVVAESLGEAKYATQHEAGTIVQEALTKARDADKEIYRQLYHDSREALKENHYVNPEKLLKSVEEIEKSLKPGSIKSEGQRKVLERINELKKDITDSTGKMMFADVRDLINNKIALNDIIDYELQGGPEKLLEGVVGQLDKLILSHGKNNPSFARKYALANKNFKKHAETFRGKSMTQLLNAKDPMSIVNKMNSVQGIKDIGKALSKSPEGRETFNNLKRLKLDKILEDNLVDSTTQNIKLGTFSKVLQKGKNREVVKELLGSQSFNRLERLLKNTGAMAKTAEKFYNASKSGVVIEDMALVSRAINDIAHLWAGNIFPIIKTGTVYGAARYINSLISNPEFLKMVEEAILASEKGNTELMYKIGEGLIDRIKTAISQTEQFHQNT